MVALSPEHLAQLRRDHAADLRDHDLIVQWMRRAGIHMIKTTANAAHRIAMDQQLGAGFTGQQGVARKPYSTPTSANAASHEVGEDDEDYDDDYDDDQQEHPACAAIRETLAGTMSDEAIDEICDRLNASRQDEESGVRKFTGRGDRAQDEPPPFRGRPRPGSAQDLNTTRIRVAADAAPTLYAEQSRRGADRLIETIAARQRHIVRALAKPKLAADSAAEYQARLRRNRQQQAFDAAVDAARLRRLRFEPVKAGGDSSAFVRRFPDAARL